MDIFSQFRKVSLFLNLPDEDKDTLLQAYLKLYGHNTGQYKSMNEFSTSRKKVPDYVVATMGSLCDKAPVEALTAIRKHSGMRTDPMTTNLVPYNYITYNIVSPYDEKKEHVVLVSLEIDELCKDYEGMAHAGMVYHMMFGAPVVYEQTPVRIEKDHIVGYTQDGTNFYYREGDHCDAKHPTLSETREILTLRSSLEAATRELCQKNLKTALNNVARSTVYGYEVNQKCRAALTP